MYNIVKCLGNRLRGITCVFFDPCDTLLSLEYRNLRDALFLALQAGGSWFVVSVTVAVIRRCVTSIICFYQGDSKREFEINPPCVLLLIICFVQCSSALILTITDIYNLTLCKWLGRSLKKHLITGSSILLEKLLRLKIKTKVKRLGGRIHGTKYTRGVWFFLRILDCA